MTKKTVLLLSVLAVSSSCFAGNAHVPCNLTNPDFAKIKEAEKRAEGIVVRKPAKQFEESNSIDSKENRG